MKKIIMIGICILLVGCLPESRCVQICESCNDNESCINYISAMCPHGCVEYETNYFNFTNLNVSYEFATSVNITPLPDFDDCEVITCPCYEEFGCMAQCYECPNTDNHKIKR